jgi:hypothetical protein
MKLYAEVPRWRLRQQLTDAAVVVWIYVWIRLGQKVHELVLRLQGAGRSLEDTGSDFAGRFDDISDTVDRLPVVGGQLQRPFGAVADGSRALQEAGATQQEVVHDLAVLLGVLLALIPILYVLIKYLPGRVRWIRDATAAQRLRIDASDLHLFALRAVATKPLYELQRACKDPAAALASGDYRPLAALELGALGLALGRLDGAGVDETAQQPER